MKRDDVLSRCQWDEYDFAHLPVASDMFGAEVEVVFMPDDTKGRFISDKMLTVLNQFLSLAAANLEQVKELLWIDCQKSFESTSYGAEPHDGQSEAEANQDEFKIHDKEDAFRSCRLERVTIKGDADAFAHSYGFLLFETPWESHGCGIVMQDGALIDSYQQ